MPRRLDRVVVWLPALLVLALAAVPAGQAPREQVPPRAVFRAGVELVRLDVRVMGSDGTPIPDLRPEEVVVTEGGVERPVVLFQRVAVPAGTYQEVARRTVGAEISTNQGAPRGSLYVLVFDQNHIRAGNEQRARRAAERFLRTRVRPGDRVALYALPGPGPQVPFTSNPQAVIAQLPSVRGSLERESLGPAGSMNTFEAFQVMRGDDAMIQRILARAAESGALLDAGRSTARNVPGAVSGESQQMSLHVARDAARTIIDYADAQSRAFLLSLSDVVRELAPIEGRKTVILVSEGFFTDNLVHEVERVAAAAAQSYAVIYSLDVNVRGADLAASQPTGGEPQAEIQSRLEALGTLASETDGELVIDANGRADSALARLAEHSQDYYIVGFEAPPEARADRDRYRRLSVRVSRPGARVSTRSGYSLRNPESGADRRRSIDLALAAPFPQQGLPIEMTTYVLHGNAPGAHRVFLSLEADLPAAAPGGPATADVVFAARSTLDARVVASGTDTIALPPAAAPGRMTARGAFQVQFDAPPGEYVMRVVVREPGGTTGSVDRRFEVRRFGGVDVTASDLVLGQSSGRLPVRAVGYAKDGIGGALEVYARRESDVEAVDVRVDLVPVGGETSVRSVAADLQPPKAVDTGYARAALVEIPLEGVPPGDYVARARVRSRGESVMEVVRQLRVEPGSAPPPAAAPATTVTPSLILGADLARRLVNDLRAGAAPDTPVARAAAQAAVGAWEQVPSLLPPSAAGEAPATLTLRGLAAFAEGDFGQAATSLAASLAAEPHAPRVAFVLGWVHALAGRQDEAVTAWRNAVLQDRRLVPAYLALAEAYVRLGHPELAEQVVQEGLRAVPDSPELTARLAALKR